MTVEPRWLDVDTVLSIYWELVTRFGGSGGIRDEAVLDSTLARPRNLLAYNSNATLFELAAAYGWGLTRNHPFVDGNKRIGVLAIFAFLYRNGLDFNPNQADEVATMRAVAAGEMSEAELASWIEGNCSPAA